MIKRIYKNTFESIKRNPVRIWAISLLCAVLITLGTILFPIPGVFLVISWIFETSMAVIFLKYYVAEDVNTDQLFELFKDKNKLLRVIGGMGWMSLKIFLWSLIPVAGIVFAIIRLYEYRLTPYILYNEPDISIKDAILVSKERTMGSKLKMFWADFIWSALASAVIAILGFLSMLNYVGWIFGIANIVLSLFVALFGFVISGIIKSAFYVELYNRNSSSEFYENDNKKYCENCGAEMRNGDVFCSSCGAKDGKKINYAEKASEDTLDTKSSDK